MSQYLFQFKKALKLHLKSNNLCKKYKMIAWIWRVLEYYIVSYVTFLNILLDKISQNLTHPKLIWSSKSFKSSLHIIHKSTYSITLNTKRYNEFEMVLSFKLLRYFNFICAPLFLKKNSFFYKKYLKKIHV